MELDDAEGFQALEHARPLMHEGDLMAEPQPWQTVGHLYRGVESGLRHLVDRYGAHEVFIGPRRGQARWQAFQLVGDHADRQPRGRAAGDRPHRRTGRGRAGRLALGPFRRLSWASSTSSAACGRPTRRSNRHATWFRHTSTSPTTPTLRSAIIENPLTARVADLFDATYETALQALGRYFVHSTESNEQVATLAYVAMRLMSRGLRPLGIALTELPVGVDRDGPRAGASFTIVPATFYLLPHRNAAWHVLRHRVGELADRAAVLAEEGPLPALARVSTDLRGLESRLAAGMPGREDAEGG